MRPVRRSSADQCLGDRAAALADGELGTDARDAALAHLVHCATCRDEVAVQRRLKARLGDLGQPQLPPGLLARISALPMVDDGGPGDGDRPLPVLSPRHRVRITSRHRPVVRVSRLPRRGVRFAMAGGVSVIALGVSAFALGGNGKPATVVPQSDLFAYEHASATDEVPFGVVEPTFRPVLVGARR